MSSIGSHWKGVNGLGIKHEVLNVISSALPCSLEIFLQDSSKLMPISEIPSTSSIDSVGRPIMKYSLICFQPPATASVTDVIRSSFVIPLFITSLSLWVPASGAKVNPLFLTFDAFSIRPKEKLSTLRDGKDKLTFSASVNSKRLLHKSGSLE